MHVRLDAPAGKVFQPFVNSWPGRLSLKEFLPDNGSDAATGTHDPPPRVAGSFGSFPPITPSVTRPMLKFAITDYTFDALDIETAILQPAGAQIVSGHCKSADELIPLVADADAVITQFAPLTAEVVNAMRRARVIVRYGIGVDNVDLAVARERGIPVCNVPDYCVDEVADHTLAMILAITRQIMPNSLHVRSGAWGLATPLSAMRTLHELTIGCVGCGRIGRAVLARLAPFKCRRLVCDPAVAAAEIAALDCAATSLNQLFAESDVITLHCPSTASTRRLLNADTLAQLKPGVAIVNLARGDLIDTAALVAGLRSGHISGAALDVCDPEPPPADHSLRMLPNVIWSSHVASASAKAVKQLRETAARLALAAVRGERLANIVNGVFDPSTA